MADEDGPRESTTLRQDPGKNMTPTHMVIVGLGWIAVGLSFFAHNAGLMMAAL